MTKTKIVLLLVALALLAMPALAQNTRPESFIPADFTGFLRLDVTDPGALSLAATTAALLQPGRFDIANFQGYDTLFPAQLLDAEEVTFSQAILPWAREDVIVAYRRLNSRLQADMDDVLAIIPPTNMLRAASTLAPIIQFQDLPEQIRHRGTTIYIGDRTAIAFTPEAVFLGAADLIQAALDVRAGTAARLIDQSAYQAIAESSPQEDFAFLYLSGAQVSPALSVILSGDVSQEPLLRALGEALGALNTRDGLGAALLTSDVEAVGISIMVHTLPELQGIGLIVQGDNVLSVEATASIVTSTRKPSDEIAFDMALLNLVPASAVVVQSGADVHSAFYDALSALPLASYVRSVLRAFPLEAAQNPTLRSAPTAEELQGAVNGLISALDDVGGFRLEDDLLAHLSGSYAAALLPRPNNPTPVLNTTFDLVLLAQTSEANAALNGLTDLLRLLTGVTFEQETLNGLNFSTLREPETGEVVARLGVIDGTLALTTGDAMQQVLDARRGDNRLIDRERWQGVSRNYTPQLFVNLGAFYNAFLPSLGGVLAEQTSLLAARGEYISETLYQLRMFISLPTS